MTKKILNGAGPVFTSTLFHMKNIFFYSLEIYSNLHVCITAVLH